MKRHWLAALFLAAFAVAATGCGGGGGGSSGLGTGVTPPPPAGADTDGDGIPNGVDAFPTDPARFAEFRPAASLDTLGGVEAIPSAINSSGEVVGASDAAAGDPVQPVVWTVDQLGVPSAPTALPGLTAGPSFGAAHGNNEAGAVVGEATADNGETVAVVWAPPAAAAAAVAPETLVVQPLSPLEPSPANARSVAFDIANPDAAGNSLVVGQSETAIFEVHPVAWLVGPDGTVVAGAKDLQVDTGDFAGTPFGRANAVADNGLVVGEMVVGPAGENDAGESRAVAWLLDPATLDVLAGPVDLGKLEGHLESAALSVNDNGVAVGESLTESGETHAVRWKLTWSLAPPSLTATLPVDLGVNSSAEAVNKSGRIAGEKPAAGGTESCALWDAATAQPTLAELLAPTAGNSSRAVGINEMGQIVGIDGGSGFVLTPN